MLTGIPNRATALDAAQRERSRQIRDGGAFSIIILDLDHFKRVNDTHGHLCGDQVLREAAHRIAASVRTYDTVGRYGGEEFLVVAPTTDGPGSLALAERIRQAVAQPATDTDAGPISLTASCGVASSAGAARLTASAMLRLADEALYRAKAARRNRSELTVVPGVVAASAVAPENVAAKS